MCKEEKFKKCDEYGESPPAKKQSMQPKDIRRNAIFLYTKVTWPKKNAASLLISWVTMNWKISGKMVLLLYRLLLFWETTPKNSLVLKSTQELCRETSHPPVTMMAILAASGTTPCLLSPASFSLISKDEKVMVFPANNALPIVFLTLKQCGTYHTVESHVTKIFPNNAFSAMIGSVWNHQWQWHPTLPQQLTMANTPPYPAPSLLDKVTNSKSTLAQISRPPVNITAIWQMLLDHQLELNTLLAWVGVLQDMSSSHAHDALTSPCSTPDNDMLQMVVQTSWPPHMPTPSTINDASNIQCTISTTQPAPMAFYQRSSLEALDSATLDHCPALKKSTRCHQLTTHLWTWWQIPYYSHHAQTVRSTVPLLAPLFPISSCSAIRNLSTSLTSFWQNMTPSLPPSQKWWRSLPVSLLHWITWQYKTQCSTPNLTCISMVPPIINLHHSTPAALLTLKLLTTLKHACFHQTLLPWVRS